MASILITGAAGFIGYHLAQRLLDRGDRVVGVDCLTDYYEVALKLARLNRLEARTSFTFVKLDLADRAGTERLFSSQPFDVVVNLAAQAGVRYSLSNPHAYMSANVAGFLNVLEGCRTVRPRHLVFASSSSVYGANARQPFSTHDPVDHPVSLYAATKRTNELMAHSYAHLYGLPSTGLRFFTVYGPWGRPDMAYFSFTKAILAGEPIEVYNGGRHKRDFTYIDDVVEAVARVVDRPAQPDPCWSAERPNPASSDAPFRLYNVGNHRPIALLDMIGALERTLGRPAVKKLLPMQAGDVHETFADVSDLARDFGFEPATPIERGLAEFVRWYREYYRV
jgi:UDP-glucuronate 4-epimerase